MENLTKALNEEMGVEVQRKSAEKCFYKVFSYLLYQDTTSFFETLDYRNSLKKEQKPCERYFVFRYMLRLIKKRHPRQYQTLCV
jgi:hypothetical protein